MRKALVMTVAAFVLTVSGADKANADHRYGYSVSYGNFGGPVYGAPVYGGPVYRAPVYGAPAYGGPVYGGPVYGGPVYGGGFGYPVYGGHASQHRGYGWGGPAYHQPQIYAPYYGSGVSIGVSRSNSGFGVSSGPFGSGISYHRSGR